MAPFPSPLRDTRRAFEPTLAAEPAPQPATRAEPLAIRFVGSGSEYFRIWIVNLLLTLVTLGLYYPFAKVRRLRYFHAATEVGGHPLSFHASPWKLLRGYGLVVLLIGAYSVAGHFSPTAGLVAFAIVALLWPALWHSALRFRLHNTGWRGLRFAFTGSRGGAYRALLAAFVPGVIWVVAATALAPGRTGSSPMAALTLSGLGIVMLLVALPVQLRLLKRYQHDHYGLGGEQTALQVPLKAFFGLALRTFGVGVLAMGAGMAPMVGLLLWLRPQSPVFFRLLPLFLMVLVLAVVRPFFIARLQNLLWRGTHSAHLQFTSDLRFRPLAALALKNGLLVVVTLGLYLPFAAVASARMRLQAMSVITTLDLDQWLARANAQDESAAGDAAGDFFGIDVGL